MQNDTPALQLLYVAGQAGGRQVLFCVPLAQHAAEWKTKTIGCCTFHYPGENQYARCGGGSSGWWLRMTNG